jgi:hypothetical protein
MQIFVPHFGAGLKMSFYSKLCIVVEEVDEAEMWLDLTIDSELLSGSLVCDLHDESLELTKNPGANETKNRAK